jgi:hypothetical protein
MNKNEAKKTAPQPSEQEIEGNWPNTVRTREELDSALEAGLASGISPYSAEEIVERAIKRFRNGKV